MKKIHHMYISKNNSKVNLLKVLIINEPISRLLHQINSKFCLQVRKNHKNYFEKFKNSDIFALFLTLIKVRSQVVHLLPKIKLPTRMLVLPILIYIH
jgi:hypothetical protein